MTNCKNAIAIIVVAMTLALTSCESEEMVDVTKEVTTSIVDNAKSQELNVIQGENGVFANNTRSSSCSYPYEGDELPASTNLVKLTPGKHYYKVRIGNSMAANNRFAFDLIEGGPVITRSVYATRTWYGSESYTLYEPCITMSGDGWRYFAKYGQADSSYDYIYYEVIVEKDATMSWSSIQ